jgi:geranylgeranyl reductase family protein
MRTVDVLVIGLGPGGASAARRAAEAGHSVLGVDRRRILGEPVQCAEFIPTPMGAYAREAGIVEQGITGMRTLLPSGTEQTSAFPGLMINRAEFDRAIAREAERNGAELWTASRMTGLDPVARVAMVRREGSERPIGYRVLVAADGPHSTTAARLGLPQLETLLTRQYTVPLQQPLEDTVIWLSGAYPGGYAWLFPKGTTANLGLGIDPRLAADLKGPLERLHRDLVALGWVGSEVRQRTGGAIPVGGLRARLHHERVLFVGDAAGLTHPITGAGIAAAVISGELAGRAAAAFLEGDTDAFDAYEEDLRDQFEVALTRAVQRRQALFPLWHTAAADEDDTQRRGWVAFEDYFDPSRMPGAPTARSLPPHPTRNAPQPAEVLT